MKPKNKRHEKILALSQGLPGLSESQRKDALKKLLPHIVKKDSKGFLYCLDCSHVWKGECKNYHAVCPHCKSKLKLNVDRWRVWNDKYYFMTITTKGGFQVLRTYWAYLKLQKSKSPILDCREVYQRWIDSENNHTIVGLSRCTLGWYMDRWSWSGDFEIRRENSVHSINPWCVVGSPSYLPILKRNGLKGQLHFCNPVRLIPAILKDNRIETLWKQKEYELVNFALSSNSFLNDYWDSIKVAVRHKYKIFDPSMWEDMIRFMKRLGKDILNPKLICPSNLTEAHDKYQRLVERKEEKERIIAEKEKFYRNPEEVIEKEKLYQKAKSKFMDLAFIDGDIIVNPLKSVEEFLEEGASQKHCVYTNGYYKKENSLVLHAKRGDEILATIEFALDSMTILQCRGKYNSIPKEKERIENLIKNNLSQIAKCKMAV